MTQVMRSDPRNVAAYTYFRCRTYGHAWFEYDSSGWSPTMGVPVTLRCERCGSERRDQISRVSGELITRTYNYAPGYQFSRDEEGQVGRPPTAVFRLMMLSNNQTEKPELMRARTRAQQKIETPPEREPSARMQASAARRARRVQQ
jgi:hypothetical protein